MHNIEQPFEFSENVLERFAVFLDKKHPRYDSDDVYAAQIWFDLPGFHQWISHYLRSDLWGQMLEYYTKLVLPNENILPRSDLRPNRIFSDFWNGLPQRGDQEMVAIQHEYRNIAFQTNFKLRAQGDIRPQSMYALTLEETQSTLAAFENNPVFFCAIACMKACMVSYSLAIQSALENRYGVAMTNFDDDQPESVSHRKLKIGLQKLSSSAKSFSLSHDLGMILLNTLRQHAEWNQKTMRLGIQQLFARQAFHSEGGRFTKCPFTKTVMSVLQLGLKRDGDNIEVVPNQFSGRFLLDLVVLLQERYAISPPAHIALDDIP